MHGNKRGFAMVLHLFPSLQSAKIAVVVHARPNHPCSMMSEEYFRSRVERLCFSVILSVAGSYYPAFSHLVTAVASLNP